MSKPPFVNPLGRRRLTLRRSSIVALGVVLAVVAPLPAGAADAGESAAEPRCTERGPVKLRNTGNHPAVVVQRLRAKAGYDYAAHFYPHPAWLYLRSGAPSQPQEAVVAHEPGAGPQGLRQ
jgi:hypothetical protein